MRNVVLETKLSKPKLKPLPSPDKLYIMADEKWIHTQGNNKKDIMMKSIVVFDGINLSS
ncbi:MAG: hypothetical protein ACOXZW_01700 [Bacilli bacterium]|nr:hypothetical protein [Bacilli bacterium]